ncbi:hypothetical protein BE17_35650, partial [Sorangium cellulosum]
EHIKIVYLQDVLNDADIDIVDNTLNNLVLNLQILNLQNVLKDVDVWPTASRSAMCSATTTWT